MLLAAQESMTEVNEKTAQAARKGKVGSGLKKKGGKKKKKFMQTFHEQRSKII